MHVTQSQTHVHYVNQYRYKVLVGSFYCNSLSKLLDVSERATVVALLSAGVMYELTACCRERMLDDCHCNYSLPSVNFEVSPQGETVYKYGGCSDRLDTPARRTRTLLRIDSASDNNCDKVDSHNAEVGLKVRLRSCVKESIQAT